jgi:serine/threonine-protein kinase
MGTKRVRSGKTGGQGAARETDVETVVLSEDRAPGAADANTVRLASDEPVNSRATRNERLPPTVPSPAGELKTTAARFEDQGELARGGMGSVHRVFDHAILRTVAQKRLHDTVRPLPGAAARFLEEARITGQLDHPNIVPVYDVGADEGGVVTSFTMKLVRGRTLTELAAEAHAAGLTGARIEALLQVFLKVCDAVSFAHSRGVIHRDLKPDNVMVGSHGQVYLMDWGAAQLRGGARASDSHVNVPGPDAEDASGVAPERRPTNFGTPVYMAPEQAQGRTTDIDERTDVFGLGAILYYILTARPPFAAPSVEEVIALARKGEVTPPQAVVPGVRLPPGLCRIAMRALAADPTLRYHSVEALKDDVAAFLRGGGWFQTLTFRAGTVIVHEGETPDAAYLINRGWCEAYKVVDGRKQSLRKMGPGDVFGETSIFTKQPRTASVVALDDVQATEITLDALEQECGPRSWMYALVKALAQRFLDLDRELTELRTQQ